ncbi:ABC transporter substrate-binding protein [Bifidobacterium dolichotidis]|uniref:ABC transporter substrate-binding protein n=1 Tax=Bifidobacterium dolichotidis TaxID=2306976 RepID=UPI003B979E9B
MRKACIAALGALALVVTAGACGAKNDDGRTHLSVWSWEPSMTQVIKAFEKENPDVVIDLRTDARYDQLITAIQDGYGQPDVMQLEYYALPQYAVSDQLEDLTHRTDGYSDFYTPGTWASAQLDGNVYGLPMDSGPMAFFYNDDVFRQAGVDASKIRTWQDYYEAAKKLKKIGVSITSDAGNAGFFDAMVWLAGGQPFTTSQDGHVVGINLTGDHGTQEFTKFWQRMIDEDLIDTSQPMWSDSWKKAVGEGKIASVFAGAWMPSLLLSDLPGGAGLWRVTQMPTPHGTETNAENGGSALSILKSSRKPEAAWRFINFACHSRQGIDIRVDGGAFPADNMTLQDKDFLTRTTITDSHNTQVPYFGGQQFNRVLAQAAQHVSTQYEYLPFEVYARSDFGSTVGQAYEWANKWREWRQNYVKMLRDPEADKHTPASPGPMVTIESGLEQWQQDLREYGYNQGFTVNNN